MLRLSSGGSPVEHLSALSGCIGCYVCYQLKGDYGMHSEELCLEQGRAEQCSSRQRGVKLFVRHPALHKNFSGCSMAMRLWAVIAGVDAFYQARLRGRA